MCDSSLNISPHCPLVSLPVKVTGGGRGEGDGGGQGGNDGGGGASGGGGVNGG